MLTGRPVDSGPPPIAGRDRATILTSAVLLLVAVAAWAHVVTSTMGGVDQSSMGGMDHTSMGSHASIGEALTFVVAWAIMMAAMMLPSALPMIGLYAATQRTQPSAVGRAVNVGVFALVYVVLWALFGVPVYVGGKIAGAIAAPILPYGIAVVLVVAGAYQLSPLKQVCLRNCRSPIGFLLGHWRPGYWGGLMMGSSHAFYCLGCCWALMAVLVAAGAMGLAWVLLVAAVVAAEKLVPRGDWIARFAGAALVVLGVAVAIRPDLAAVLRGT